MEYERRFLLTGPPPGAESHPHTEILQGYISYDPVIRLRKSGSLCFLTIKSANTGVGREEFELPVSEENFSLLWKKTEPGVISKTRYFIPIGGGLTAELDVFKGGLEGLVIAEVEFVSAQAAEIFNPPAWFGAEVTNDYRFSNNNLAKSNPNTLL